MNIFNIFNKNNVVAPWEKYYSDDELNIKIKNINLYDQLRSCVKKYPDNIAIEYFNNKIKYKKLLKRIDKCANSFKFFGIKKGDIVTICLPNVPEALICLYALNKIGAICNMVHPLMSEEEIKVSLNSTKSVMLIVTDMCLSKINNIKDSVYTKKIISVRVSDSMDFVTGLIYKISNIKFKCNKEYIKWKTFIRKYSKKRVKYRFKKYGKNAAAVILHSGGTSGTPKNVVLQNRSFILLTEQERRVLKNINVGDACLAIMPNFHGFGLGVSMHTQLVCGVKVILVPKFDSKKFDTLLKKTKPALVLGVPTLYEALANSKNESKLDLSCLKYIFCGGDQLSKSLEDKINKYLEDHNCKTKITQGYGLSEALAAVTLGFGNVNKSGSVGIPLPTNYVKIINPATRENLPFNEIGEICIHNEAMMMGYLNEESETNEALQIHDDGIIWLHTGDLGLMDEDGFIFYKGRQKRMIISSGFNVYPNQVENVIEAHPSVLQCTVVGMPHPYKKEVVKAFIVLKDGFHGIFVKQEIKEYCKKNLEYHAIPYKFIYRKKLPKTKLGKVDFRALSLDNGDDDDE